MIAYHFPPAVNVGRLRTIKFCKYLPQFGWTPVVLAPEVEPHLDPDPYGEISAGTEVHRFGRDDFHPRLLTSAQRIRETAAKVARALGHGGEGESTAEERPVSPLGKGSSLSVLLHTLTYWPDDRCTWILPAVRKGLALGRSCDAIYSTGNPWSDHAVASRVKRFTGLPWVMDFRDPWMLGGVLEYTSSLQRRILRGVERRWVGRCDRMIQVTEPLTERYRAAYSDQPPDKFLTLPNGFDPGDFEDLPAPPSDLPVTMTYIGSLSADRSPTALIRGVALLLERNLVGPGILRIRLIGPRMEAYAGIIERSGVSALFDLLPPLPYRSALEELARSHVALLIGGREFGKTALPTKLYEYFAARRHILALVPEGHMADKLTTAGAPCVDCRDSDGLAAAVLDIIETFRKHGRLPPPRELPDQEAYSRVTVARRLASMLDELVRTRPRVRRRLELEPPGLI